MSGIGTSSSEQRANATQHSCLSSRSRPCSCPSPGRVVAAAGRQRRNVARAGGSAARGRAAPCAQSTRAPRPTPPRGARTRARTRTMRAKRSTGGMWLDAGARDADAAAAANEIAARRRRRASSERRVLPPRAKAPSAGAAANAAQVRAMAQLPARTTLSAPPERRPPARRGENSWRGARAPTAGPKPQCCSPAAGHGTPPLVPLPLLAARSETGVFGGRAPSAAGKPRLMRQRQWQRHKAFLTAAAPGVAAVAEAAEARSWGTASCLRQSLLLPLRHAPLVAVVAVRQRTSAAAAAVRSAGIVRAVIAPSRRLPLAAAAAAASAVAAGR